MNLYASASYKAFLKCFVTENQRRGLLTEMAKAIGCTHSYLSQVLNAKPDLTPDQALAATVFMGLNEEASEYFLALVFHDRASTPALRGHYQRRLTEMKHAHFELSSRVKKTADTRLSPLDQQNYYATTLPAELHLLTSCRDYQTVEALTEKLDIPATQIKRELEKLVANGLVNERARRYQHSGKNLHLDGHSPLNRINHLNWRLKAAQDSENQDAIHYTSSFTISRDDWPKLKEALLKFIEIQRVQIGTSGADEAFVFCCDLFPLT